ncbi:MAG: cupredoxin domain-containing protein [Actinobacteria bacterium]|nr:cupredoxin domain-containing protein [Actinomycetota bacterium]
MLAALLAATLLTGCGGEDAPTASAGTTTTIRIKDFKFVPDSATVKAGIPISVPNEDRAPHTLTDAADPRAFDSGTIDTKQTGSITFDKRGTYSVFCELHPYMKGKVTVVE